MLLELRGVPYFSNSEELAQTAVEAGNRSGERTWAFPVGAEYHEGLESSVADLAQLARGPGPDHIYAATFLSHFVVGHPLGSCGPFCRYV